ncbi:MAG: MBL fold metallo-hydrolase [Alphaproteobacteria bacterium]
MKITILGCGASCGVPSLHKGFGICNPKNPKNNRFRSAVLIEEQGQNILIDTPPEIRLELLWAQVKKIDALLYTHSHFDHIAGAEDVRNFTRKQGKVLDIYGSKNDLKVYKNQAEHVFRDPQQKETVALHPVQMYHPFNVKGIDILPIKQYHGPINSVGYRIGNFAYSTDVKRMDPKGLELLKGIKTWVLECTTNKITAAHISLPEIKEWIELIQPQKVFLTHLGTEWDYDQMKRLLPQNVKPAYDGLKINT